MPFFPRAEGSIVGDMMGQSMLKRLVKYTLATVGLDVEWRDRLLQSIPADYEMSPFLPRLYRESLERILYFHEMLQKAEEVDGDIVECGVSIGHGTLLFLLLSELATKERTYYGFDSFEGFPQPSKNDLGTYVYKGFYATPPEIIHRVLRDGGVSEETIKKRVRLIKGFFDRTLNDYQGNIAFLHLDCDLYDSYKVCLENLYDKVVPNGVIMFDEYEDDHFPGARKAIDEFFADKPESPIRHEYGKYYVVKA